MSAHIIPKPDVLLATVTAAETLAGRIGAKRNGQEWREQESTPPNARRGPPDHKDRGPTLDDWDQMKPAGPITEADALVAFTAERLAWLRDNLLRAELEIEFQVAEDAAHQAQLREAGLRWARALGLPAKLGPVVINLIYGSLEERERACDRILAEVERAARPSVMAVRDVSGRALWR